LTRATSTSPPSTTSLAVRRAGATDAAAVAAIYNQGIEEREATFETESRSADEVEHRIVRGDLMLVAERAGEVVGFAAVAPYSSRPAYAGVGECAVYVQDGARRAGVGALLLDALAEQAAGQGLHKLVGRLFTTNRASISLVRRCGFQEVGVHRRHAKLDGRWRDVLVVERLLGEAAEG
jgi:L-amino acid N-acyltransferase YncA